MGFFVAYDIFNKTIKENNVMGEWSEYFEDFPEENPANQPPTDEQRLGPKSKYFPEWHETQLTKEERAFVQTLIEEEEAKALAYENEIKNAPIIKSQDCPICYADGFVIKKLKDETFYCNCNECNVIKIGTNLDVIIEELKESLWDNKLDY
ncbi:hypothetical protein [Acinetobacter sp. YK3]|uniref:hypothetical protein n=1 Tax=Acinetobacter sp. YK3 TaxID=1860097 RepID=UPI001112F8D4|nr:hypothetical protein [Acinetobacter sp. YK3]